MLNTQSPRLLVVDDEKEFGDLVGEVAEKLGFAVRVTYSGAEFRAAFQELQPTHVSLDIVMPEQDGIEIIHWLAMQQASAKILLISGYNPQHMKTAVVLATARNLEVVAQLQKPVTLAALREALGSTATIS